MADAGNKYRHEYEDVAERVVWATMHDALPLCSTRSELSSPWTNDYSSDSRLSLSGYRSRLPVMSKPATNRANSRFAEYWMSIDAATVAKIARLARLKVPEEEQAPLAGELSGILGWIEQLNEVDTANVEPLASVSDVTLPLRQDVVTDGGIAAKVLANAPGGAVYIEPTDPNAGGFFTVPKVVE